MASRALLAFCATLLACPPVLVALRLLQVVDRPNARSSHARPTPRGGGLAVAIGALVALAWSPAADPWRTALLVAGGFALLGLADDLWDLSAFRRLAVQVALAVAALPLLLRDLDGPPAWRVVFAAGVLVWLIAHVNLFNFMDGINGIAAIQAIVAGGAWWVIGRAEGVAPLAVGGAILAASAAAFLPFNFPRATVFLGDVGSYFLGAWMAVLVVVGLRAGLPPEALLAPLALSLADTTWTVVGRLRRGEPVHEAHAEHAYQRLVQGGWSHTATSLFFGALMAACAAAGALTAAVESVPARVLADLAIAGVVLAYLASPGALTTRRLPRAAAAQ